MTASSEGSPGRQGSKRLKSDEAEFLMRLAISLRAIRSDVGLTMRELASVSGVSERFLVELEAGRANPSVLVLRQVAAALETDLAELVAESGLPESSSREPEERRPFVTLVGLRGAGKSTIGAQVSARLGVPFVELDQRIESRVGLSSSSIFELHGTTYYRRIEREALGELLESGGPAIVATAGALVTDPSNFELLKQGTTTVWLQASAEDHFARVLAQGDTRPMARREDAMVELKSLLRARRPLYEQASHSVDTSKLGLSRAIARVERIARKALFRRSVTRSVSVRGLGSR